MKSLGKHHIIELYNCCKNAINDVDRVENVLLKASELAGATIIKSAFHKFNPHGISGIIVIAESHFSIHTWPEYGYCALDIFTCGNLIDNDIAISYIKEKFSAESVSVVEIKRGVLGLNNENLKHKPDSVCTGV